jgi:hypothetical protein
MSGSLSLARALVVAVLWWNQIPLTRGARVGHAELSTLGLIVLIARLLRSGSNGLCSGIERLSIQDMMVVGRARVDGRDAEPSTRHLSVFESCAKSCAVSLVLDISVPSIVIIAVGIPAMFARLLVDCCCWSPSTG